MTSRQLDYNLTPTRRCLEQGAGPPLGARIHFQPSAKTAWRSITGDLGLSGKTTNAGPLRVSIQRMPKVIARNTAWTLFLAPNFVSIC